MKPLKILLATTALGLLTARAAPPPASAYAEYPPAESAKLSPDGKMLVFINGSGEKLAPMVATKTAPSLSFPPKRVKMSISSKPHHPINTPTASRFRS